MSALDQSASLAFLLSFDPTGLASFFFFFSLCARALSSRGLLGVGR